MLEHSETKLAIFVLWQSLVVKAYRSFFYKLAETANVRVACASPQKFRELGSQDIIAEDFEKPFAKNDKRFPFFLLKSWNLHVQIVIFLGLVKALRTFFVKNKIPSEKKIFLCIADPYSVTAFVAWCVGRLSIGRDMEFVLYASQNIYKNLPFPLRWIQSFLFKRCSAILSLGPEQEEVIRKHGYKGPCFDFPLWFDSQLFRVEEEKELNSKFVLSFAGSLVPEKGIQDLMHAWERMSDVLKQTSSLRIAGRGPLKDEIEKKCAHLQSQGLDIQYLGALSSSDMRSFYLESDILIVPSRTAPHWKEQFGRVIVEAQACGVMVLGSDSGAIPSVIQNPDYVFKEGDISDMVRVMRAALITLQNSSRKSLRWKLSTEAYQRFSDTVLAKQLIQNLSKLNLNLSTKSS